MGIDEPRVYTREEVRKHLLNHVRFMVDYWIHNVPETNTLQDRLDGLAFSILVALDGCAAGLPGFYIIPSVAAEDEAYNKDNGDNWYPYWEASEDVCDIGGGLHEEYYQRKPE